MRRVLSMSEEQQTPPAPARRKSRAPASGKGTAQEASAGEQRDDSTPGEAQAIRVCTLPVSSIQVNDYNPNEMTPDQQAELEKEIAHLGRLPKPVVVRRTGEDTYLVIDGEHSLRAAVKLGHTEVPCEVVEADDFE